MDPISQSTTAAQVLYSSLHMPKWKGEHSISSKLFVIYSVNNTHIILLLRLCDYSFSIIVTIDNNPIF